MAVEEDHLVDSAVAVVVVMPAHNMAHSTTPATPTLTMKAKHMVVEAVTSTMQCATTTLTFTPTLPLPDHVHAAVLPLAPLPAPICDMQCFLSTDQDGFHGYAGGYLVDSAATTSVCNDLSHYVTYCPLAPDRTDSVATGGGCLFAAGYGTVIVQDDIGHPLKLIDVMHVPDSPVCIMSVPKINAEGGTVKLNTAACTIDMPGGNTYVTTKTFKGIFLMHHFVAVAHVVNASITNNTPVTLETWHKRLGHVGYDTIVRMAKTQCVNGLNIVKSSMTGAKDCLGCIQGKFVRSPFPPDNKTELKPLSHLYCDASGPYPKSIDGHKYFISVRDKYTGYTITTTSSTKAGADFVKQAIEYLEKNSGHTVTHIRTDQGKEFLNEKLITYLNSKGIIYQTTAIDSSSSNGPAERTNRTVFDRLRATLADANQPRLLWNYIVNHVVHAMNMIPAVGMDKSPHEMLFGKVPDVSHLRAFGAECVVWTPSSRQLDKLQPRGDLGYMAGYVPESTTMYKVRPGGTVCVCALEWHLTA